MEEAELPCRTTVRYLSRENYQAVAQPPQLNRADSAWRLHLVIGHTWQGQLVASPTV
jgi:hypothetical protein